MKFDYLVVALGNIGEEYAFTRHNIGWIVADKLLEKLNAKLEKASASYNLANCKYMGKNIGIVYPTTYMNRSGDAVAYFISKKMVEVENVIAMVDEYNFEPGKVHLKKGGSDGGHNGIASLIDKMKTPEFLRLRFGIGKNFRPGGMADYVLSNFLPSEQKAVEYMANRGSQAILHICKVGVSRAMSDINSGKELN